MDALAGSRDGGEQAGDPRLTYVLVQEHKGIHSGYQTPVRMEQAPTSSDYRYNLGHKDARLVV